MPALYGAPLCTSTPSSKPPSLQKQGALTSHEGEATRGDTVLEQGERSESNTSQPTGDGFDTAESKALSSEPQTEAEPQAGGQVESTPVEQDTSNVTANPDPQSVLPGPFPVIVFSHGLGGMRTTYSTICCDLASHGYVIASVEHKDQSACLAHGRVPRRGAQENQFKDDWIQFYHRPTTEPEFPLRHRQVRKCTSI